MGGRYGTIVRDGLTTVTRDNMETDVIYELPDGTAFTTVGGGGRFYYEDTDEAMDQHGDDLPIIAIDRAED